MIGNSYDGENESSPESVSRKEEKNNNEIGGVNSGSANEDSGKMSKNYYECLESDNDILGLVPTKIPKREQAKKVDNVKLNETTTVSDNSSIDQSESSYDRIWSTANPAGKNTADQKKDLLEARNQLTEQVRAEKPSLKTKFVTEMPKHESIGGKSVPKGSNTKKVLTAEEVKYIMKPLFCLINFVKWY